MVGCRSMKALIDPDTHIITRMASTMAATMMGNWSGRARPTAVKTESSENTMSMSAIWMTMAAKFANTRVCRSSLAPSGSRGSRDALGQQEQAA